MPSWLPWALLGFIAILLAAMPWRRLDPNYEFILQMLRLLEDEDTQILSSSSSTGRRSTTDAEDRTLSSHQHK